MHTDDRRLSDRERERYTDDFLAGMFAEDAIKLQGEYKFAFHDTLPGFDEYERCPMYFNGRIIQSRPELRLPVAALLVDMIDRAGLSFHYISGVPRGALHMAAILCDRLEMGHLDVREPKSHGLSAPIDGAYLPGSKALIFEDTVSTAGSLIVHATKLGENDIRAADAACLMSYALDEISLSASHIRLRYLLDEDIIASYAKRHGIITAERAEYIVGYYERLRADIAASRSTG